MVVLIAHRGNLLGPDPVNENHPIHIQHALYGGYHAHIDLWVLWVEFYNEDGDDEMEHKDEFYIHRVPHLFLGHESPRHEIHADFLNQHHLWIECRNVDALHYCITHDVPNPFFAHHTDGSTLTSSHHIWTTDPNDALSRTSIAVCPEDHPFPNLSTVHGICSSHVGKELPFLLEEFTLKDCEEGN